MKTRVTLYTRPGCCLCDDAKAAMYAAGVSDEFELEEVNIDLDPELRARYTNDIPVVLVDGVKAFKHRVSSEEFARKLRRIAGARRSADLRP